MSREEENKTVVGRWFTHFWGETCDLGIVDELAARDMLLQYSLQRRGAAATTSRCHDRLPQGVSEPQFLGYRGPDCQGRLRRRALGKAAERTRGPRSPIS
jgi:hypothetical protein